MKKKICILVILILVTVCPTIYADSRTRPQAKPTISVTQDGVLTIKGQAEILTYINPSTFAIEIRYGWPYKDGKMIVGDNLRRIVLKQGRTNSSSFSLDVKVNLPVDDISSSMKDGETYYWLVVSLFDRHGRNVSQQTTCNSLVFYKNKTVVAGSLEYKNPCNAGCFYSKSWVIK